MAFALPIGVDPSFSRSRFANDQIALTAMLALSAWLASTQGFAARIGHTLGWTITGVDALAMSFTDSRSAGLAILRTPLLYACMLSWRVRPRPNSLNASSVLFADPVPATLLAGLVVVWRRLHVMIIGGAPHQDSTDARATQSAMGSPKLLAHPFGRGSGTSGNVSGFSIAEKQGPDGSEND